jgi:uncharacterized damage-inducible protein DinB
MTPTLQPMLNEFREEAAITRRVLARIPADKLTWKPHAKSMTLGQLAMHIATVPGALSKIAQLDEFDAGQANFTPPQPKTLEEIQAALEESIRDAEECIGGMTEQRAMGTWRLLVNGKQAASQPRVGVLRSIMLNHWYHHRGQLSVYLRLLDVPVPVIYGRSADENPFA